MQLRDYQQAAITDIRQAFTQHRRVLYQLPTGSGKTVIFCEIARQAVAKGKRVLVIVHRQELLRQTIAKVSAACIPWGAIAPGYSMQLDWPLQIAMVQTAARRDIGQYDLIICDEAHHAVAGSWHAIIETQPQAYILGVSATPCRMDGKGLSDAFDVLLEGVTMRELIEAGYLCAPKVYAASVADVSGVRKLGGDYNRGELDAAMDKPKITGDAVAEYRKLADGKPAIVFCVSVQHAERVADMFRAEGYRAEAVDGSLPDDERKRRINGLADGSVQVLTSCDIVSEGTDIPAVECAILLRPTQSEALYLQQVGRALRPVPGKQHAVILDHAGNVFRHGMPTAAREWTLDGRPKQAKQQAVEAVRQCKQCYAVHQAAFCPECGAKAPEKPRKVKQVAGQLVPIEDVERAKREAKVEVWGAKSLEELKAIAFRRGYKPGWAWHRWQMYNKSRA
ncbi:SSL2 DNA or RNA helicases of superfamily II [uncultured Caudovirales phage]|uniref:SSL2 DNA or RNA helicases of superfamily II n=1 Tax=uncultured Caudovirales phage TaxID=2100421 RepID=A0A6J5M761_9CAUD|nr:SSL2 DNA or RNA helicases of superfamily II [uncultured Caudovirales phage]